MSTPAHIVPKWYFLLVYEYAKALIRDPGNLLNTLPQKYVRKAQKGVVYHTIICMICLQIGIDQSTLLQTYHA